jgi:hypothetical protein
MPLTLLGELLNKHAGSKPESASFGRIWDMKIMIGSVFGGFRGVVDDVNFNGAFHGL